MANASLSPIYERLNGVQQYHPFSAKTFADWASEAGDTVQISREGTSYSVPVHKQSLVWRGKHMINMESTGSKERTPIERMSNRKENETSAGMSAARGYGGGAGRNIEALQYDFYSEDGMYQSQLRMDEQQFRTIFTKTGIEGLPEGTSLSTMISQNAEQITLEAIRAKGQETELSSRITVEAGRITQEVNRATTEEGKLSGRITVEADRITQEVSRATSAEGSLSGRITVEAGKINQIVSNIGSDGTVTAASICLAINNGGSSATINADKIYLLGQTIANTITADYIDGKIATLSTMHGISASFSGNVSASGAVMGSGLYIGSGTSFQSVSDGIKLVQVVPDGNNYKLQYQKFNSDGWVDASTFSRATTLSGGWSGGKFTVNASPQGKSFSTTIVQGTATWNGNSATVPIEAIDSDNPGYQYATGRSVLVDASGRYNSGYDSGWNACRTAMLNSADRLSYYTGTVTTKYDAPSVGATARQVIYPYTSHTTTLYTVPDRR